MRIGCRRGSDTGTGSEKSSGFFTPAAAHRHGISATLLWVLFLSLTSSESGSSSTGSGTFFYASSPTHANETLLLLGGPSPGMLAAAFIQLCAAATAACTLLPNVQRAAASAKAVLPPALPLDVFTVAPCAAAEAATCAPPSPLLVNAPRVAWQQGDAGEAAASPSGYIRLFGSALAFSAPPLARCVPTLRGSGGGGAASAASVSLLPAGGGGGGGGAGCRWQTACPPAAW